MRKLAEKIEYSPGSVYLHFKNKDELFDCLTEESFARLLQTFLNLRNGREPKDPFEELKRAMRAYVEFGLRNPNDYRFAFMLRPPVEKRPYKVHQALRRSRAKTRFHSAQRSTK
jgi:AcrR family transcriptional regulator